MRGALLLLATALAAAGCRSPAPAGDAGAATGERDGPRGATVVTGSRQLMGTDFEISTAGGPEAQAREAIDAALDAIDGISHRLNSHDEASDVARINAAAGVEPVRVSDETLSLLELCRHYSEVSGGTFDVTFAALIPVWRVLREQPPRLPTDQEIEAARALVDYRRLVLDRAAMTAFLPERGMAIGLGGIGEGYGVDQGAKVLLDHGVHDFIMGGGGDMMVRGTKNGLPWTLGIQHPRRPGELLGEITVDHDLAVATSGDYERFVEIGGVRYHHILDPRTGRPSRGCISATLVGPDATLVDALATAVFVLGPTEGMRLVERTPGVEALLVDDQLRITMSPSLRPRVRLIE
jgi:FAD:protein FMN transferase